jgi:DNA-binding transcriptional LysR family regulator
MVAAPSPAQALTLESLQLVDAIAHHGSFGRAARALGRVPSAVTYSVRRLEDDLDVLLFDRRGHKAELTPAGEELLREGRHLLAAADDLVRRVQRVARGWERDLRIALDGVIAFERLLPYLARFCTLAPTQVRITHEVLGGTWDALSAGRADIGIGATHDGPPTARLGVPYRTLELGRVAFVFAVAPTHPLATLPEPLPSPSCGATGRSWWPTPRSTFRRAPPGSSAHWTSSPCPRCRRRSLPRPRGSASATCPNRSRAAPSRGANSW